ncbi:SMC-Scp complex subunit ScpB [Thermodesulfobacteriota bacterium]
MAKSLKLIVESLLFSSDQPLTAREISSCVPDADISDIKSALKVLEHEYEMLDRSFKLKEVAKGYQFRTRTEYGSYILKLLQTTPNRLSKAAMETLAIIAYKQPILRYEIERLRGVDVGGILKTLLEKGLTRIMGRKDLPGRPLIYGTTNRFLEVFDLKDVSSLPKLKEIKAFGVEEFIPTSVRKGTSSEKESEEEISETGPPLERSEEDLSELPDHDPQAETDEKAVDVESVEEPLETGQSPESGDDESIDGEQHLEGTEEEIPEITSESDPGNEPADTSLKDDTTY